MSRDVHTMCRISLILAVLQSCWQCCSLADEIVHPSINTSLAGGTGAAMSSQGCTTRLHREELLLFVTMCNAHAGAPFDPANPPPPPPSSWQSMLHAISGIVHFFGRLSFLVDENAHAVHFFIAALLQLLDR